MGKYLYDPTMGLGDNENKRWTEYDEMPDFSGQAFQQHLAQKNMMNSSPSAAETTAKTGQTAAMAATPFMLTPQGAAVGVGSQLVMGYLAQKAADERAKRERAALIAQQHGEQEQQGFNKLIDVYRGALG